MTIRFVWSRGDETIGFFRKIPFVVPRRTVGFVGPVLANSDSPHAINLGPESEARQISFREKNLLFQILLPRGYSMLWYLDNSKRHQKGSGRKPFREVSKSHRRRFNVNLATS